MYTFEIDFINRYGHIVKCLYIDSNTKESAIKKANKEKDFSPECYIVAYRIK